MNLTPPLIFNKEHINNGLEQNAGNVTSIVQQIARIDHCDLYKLLDHVQSGITNFFYWSNPSKNFSFIAFDELLSLSSDKYLDPEQLKEELNKIYARIISDKKLKKNFAFPLFVGGIKFQNDKKEKEWNDFQYSKWFIPKIMLVQNEEGTFTVINSFVNRLDKIFLEQIEKMIYETRNYFPVKKHKIKLKKNNAIENDYDAWNKKVNAALKNISDGKFEKVVLARIAEIEFEKPPDFSFIMPALQKNYNDCTTFAFKQNESIFFGSTPENLFTIKNLILATEAVAGSIARGTDLETDSILETQLLNSEKNLNEHRSVFNYILKRLDEVSEKIEYNDFLKVKKLSNIQHLWLPMKAIIKKGTSIFNLIKVLHPTPAVCGFPTNEAFSFIEHNEDFDRGLYAGVIGWFDEEENGNFAVGIRSAMLRGKTLRAYAGCGIVEGSDPLSEYYETILKLKPIISLFE